MDYSTKQSYKTKTKNSLITKGNSFSIIFPFKKEVITNLKAEVYFTKATLK